MLTTRQHGMDILLLSSYAQSASKQSISEAFEVTLAANSISYPQWTQLGSSYLWRYTFHFIFTLRGYGNWAI